MSDSNNQTSVSKDNVSEFPVAAIVCLSVGGYVILVIVFLVVRRMLVTKGSCQSDYCCPDNGNCCSNCGKINGTCPNCCSCSNTEECFAVICCTQKKLNCGDLCCSFSRCRERCCDPCSCSNPASLCCCKCPAGGCCAGESFCPSCFDDIDPKACGCLCLEIKLRSSQCGNVRNASAPPRGIQNQHFNSHGQPDKVVGNHENIYQASGKLDEGTTNEKLGTLKIRGDNIRERQRSSSHSPAKTTSHYQQMLTDRSDKSNIQDILSENLKDQHSFPIEGNNMHVIFNEVLEKSNDRNEDPHNLPHSTIVSSSLSGDSSKDLSSRLLLNKTSNTGSNMETTGRLTSRPRRLVRPGQKSQRFPNKILISSESLKCSMETTTDASVVSFTQSSDKSLLNTSTNFDALNLSRPLPTLRKTEIFDIQKL